MSQLLVFQKHLAYNNLTEIVGDKSIVCGEGLGSLGSDSRFYEIMSDLSLVDILDYGNGFLNDGLGRFFDVDCLVIGEKPKKEKGRYRDTFNTLWRNQAYLQFEYIRQAQEKQ